MNTVVAMNNSEMFGAFQLHKDARIPEYGTRDAACFDIRTCFSHIKHVKGYSSYNQKENLTVNKFNGKKYITLFARSRALIPTGLVFGIPQNYSLRLHMRSGLALKQGLMLANGEGVVDADYTHETFVMLYNGSESSVKIKDQDRICQGELVPLVQHSIVTLSSAPTTDSDRVGGFGSTGTN